MNIVNGYESFKYPGTFSDHVHIAVVDVKLCTGEVGSNCWQLEMGEERNARLSEIELKGNKAWLKGVPWKRNTPTLS